MAWSAQHDYSNWLLDCLALRTEAASLWLRMLPWLTHLWLYTISFIGASQSGFDICSDLGYNGRWLAVTDGGLAAGPCMYLSRSDKP